MSKFNADLSVMAKESSKLYYLAGAIAAGLTAGTGVYLVFKYFYPTAVYFLNNNEYYTLILREVLTLQNGVFAVFALALLRNYQMTSSVLKIAAIAAQAGNCTRAEFVLGLNSYKRLTSAKAFLSLIVLCMIYLMAAIVSSDIAILNFGEVVMACICAHAIYGVMTCTKFLPLGSTARLILTRSYSGLSDVVAVNASEFKIAYLRFFIEETSPFNGPNEECLYLLLCALDLASEPDEIDKEFLAAFPNTTLAKRTP